ncbi:MAG TPA: NAD(P)-binding domain-containing protein, partial [Actinomycetota bacterium]|nr:NAD(P)-binding domain-containing protein [Actinomycetota bacterium]
MDVAIVGAGRVGTALGVLLARAGHRIVAVSGRWATRERAAAFLPDVPVLEPAEAAEGADLVLIATPDDAIASTCAALAGSVGDGRWVAHVSGATGLDALAPARRAGAGVLAIHPLQTFPDVDAALDRIPG